MSRVVEFVLANGWEDAKVAELERYIETLDLEAALAMVESMRLSPFERRALVCLVIAELAP